MRGSSSNRSKSLGSFDRRRKKRKAPYGAKRPAPYGALKASVGVPRSKYFDQLSDTPLICDTYATSGLTMRLLNPIPVGATFQQRVGTHIALKSLNLKRQVRAGDGGIRAVATMMLVYDKSPGLALPFINEFLSGIGTSMDPPNPDYQSRFIVLRRWDDAIQGNFNPTGAPVAGTLLQPNQFQYKKDFIDLKGLPVVYGPAGTGTLGDIQVGALYLVCTGINSATGTASPEVIAYTRVRYNDTKG